jgi:Fur family transcriptional regulator, ferric uptake regulator
MDETKLRSYLAAKGYKLSQARGEVFAVLQQSPIPLSNAEIIHKLRGVIDKTSVYRVLSLFESIGVTHRLWNGFKSKSELTDAFSVHHHHFTCRRCGTISGFESKTIEDSLKRLAQSRGITITAHQLELSGYCKDCSKQAA